ncbi:hypothetical protein IJ095_02300 [Candidatus Saccharibacteria bacterium]|nr:hypothetical protein [Candidatus Saccharibacteria bacterium]
MAKLRGEAIGKRLKISRAQSNMLGAVAGAAIVLGASLVLGVYFLKYIRFNAAVISAKDDAIEGYSNAIRDYGVCKKPRGKIYSSSELKNCVPDDVRVGEVSGTLRYNVMVTMAQNQDLESVARNGLSVCVDSNTGEKYSYDTLYSRYENSTNEKDKALNLEIFGLCSSLRAIPDALPGAKNELALMASLDKIFKLSGWEPDSMSPGGDAESEIEGLGAIGVNLSVNTNSTTTIRVLQNIEKSIREINIETASIEWSSGDQLEVNASATAYYTEEAMLQEGLVTVKGTGKITKSGGTN